MAADSARVRSLAWNPELRAGWEPDAPVGDTVVRRFLHNWSESFKAPVAASGGRVLVTDDVVAADAGRPAGFLNAVVLRRPLALEDVSDVAGVLAEHHRDGSGAVWLFSAWPTPDLTPFGWQLEGHPPLMLRPPAQPSGRRSLPASITIDPVTDDGPLRELEAELIEGYPFPELAGAAAGALFDPRLLADPRLRLWLAREGGRPVGAAAAFVDAGLVDVMLVGTLPEARGQGVGTALTWSATLADPDVPAVLLASDDGRPVYERMGYLPLLRFTCWRLPRG